MLNGNLNVTFHMICSMREKDAKSNYEFTLFCTIFPNRMHYFQSFPQATEIAYNMHKNRQNLIKRKSHCSVLVFPLFINVSMCACEINTFWQFGHALCEYSLVLFSFIFVQLMFYAVLDMVKSF